MPHRIIEAFEVAKARATSRMVSADAADRRHLLRRIILGVFLQRLVAAGPVGDEFLVDQVLLDDGVDHRVQQSDVGIGLELQHAPGVARQIAAPRVGVDQLGAALGGVLHPGRRHRVVRGRVGADQEDHLGVLDVVHLVRHRARADALEQRHHRRGMAKARAMVDVVLAEAGAHQLLEQVGLFVRALGRAEAGERVLVLLADLPQPLGRLVEGDVPRHLLEYLAPVGGIDGEHRGLREAGLADQRLGQALRMRRIVETIAALDAQAVMVRRTVLAVDELDDVLLGVDVIGQQAAHAAERAHRVHGLVDGLEADIARRHQSAGRARLHALAAGDAGRVAHRVVEVEHDLRVLAAERVADDVVHLLLAAGAQAARALDAGVEVDGDRRVRQIGFDLLPGLEPRLADLHLLRPGIELVVLGVRGLGHVREQQLEHQLLRQHRARVVGGDLHAFLGKAAAGRRQRALALDLDHAGAAVAVRAQPRLVAEVRDLDAVLLRALDDAFIRAADHRPAIELELDRHHRQLLGAYPFHHPTSCGKYFITVSAGLGAACPRPQIEASIIA